jgi:hypothetical protein
MSELRARRILAAEGYRYAGHDVCDDPADCYLPIVGVDPPQVPLLILHGQNPQGGLVTFFLTETPSVDPRTRTGVSRPGAEFLAERSQTHVQATTSTAPLPASRTPRSSATCVTAPCARGIFRSWSWRVVGC